MKQNYSNIRIYGEYNYEKDSKLYSMTDVVYSVYNTNNYNVRLALPNKLYESIVCGNPIIVTSDTYLENYVKNLELGFPSLQRCSSEKLIKSLLVIKTDSRYFK